MMIIQKVILPDPNSNFDEVQFEFQYPYPINPGEDPTIGRRVIIPKALYVLLVWQLAKMGLKL